MSIRHSTRERRSHPKERNTSPAMSSPSLRSRMLAYCCASFGFSLLSSTFSFYYVKVFLNLYHIEEGWFHMAQVLYLVWNAINDPLFAYWQDTSGSWLVRTRRELILYTGPFFGLAYLIAWFPWGNSGWVTGVHLIVSLCLYDTMFTFIGLALCCLFTEIAVNETDRISLTRYSQVAGFLASFSITVCELTSNSLKNFQNFQLTVVVLAVLSGIFMYYCGKHGHTHYDVKRQAENVQDVQESKIDSSDKAPFQYLRITWQFLSDRNFLSFVLTNFLQEFHRAFVVSFTVIICDQLMSENDLHPNVRSFFYGSLGSLHTIILVIGAPLVNRLGYSSIIRWNFLWKIISGIILAFLGQGHPYLLILILLSNSTYTNLAFSLFNLCLSDVADHNMERYNRKHPLSSMVFGTNALVVKPSQSLSPMLIVYILNKYGYERLKKDTLDGAETLELKSAMFTLLWCLPLVLGVLQTITWSFYSLNRRKREDITLEI